jgi:hypothetical protein
MTPPKKMTSKGHTLYEDDLPKSTTDVWVLIAESCFEISQTLLAEDSYAEEIYFSVSDYSYLFLDMPIKILPEKRVRFSSEIYRELYAELCVHELIVTFFEDIRRIQVRVKCSAYVPILFEEESGLEKGHHLLEKIRLKTGLPDVIGHGLEGCRKQRISTYTPKRSDEIKRAYQLLSKKPYLIKMLETAGKIKAYMHRIF